MEETAGARVHSFVPLAGVAGGDKRLDVTADARPGEQALNLLKCAAGTKVAAKRGVMNLSENVQA